MKTKTLKGVSALALLFGASGISQAVAQQTPAPAPNQTVAPAGSAQQSGPQTAPAAADQTGATGAPAASDKVVITGSLIATTPEDAPKPVEVYDANDLKQQGTPNVTEFIRSLTLSYGDDLGFGQASPDVPEGTGFGNANMRGLGSNATLALMNGRPLAPWNGSFGADINTVPMEALEAVEVLKGGASATYGAGAVGGVLNFRTRRDIDAPQVSIEKQFYDGSDGYYKVDFLTGWVGDAGNLMVSLSHSHEDEMLMTERDFSSPPFQVNPGSLTGPTYTLTSANPGQFQVSSTGDFYTSLTPIAAGTAINDYRTASDCTSVGGTLARDLQTNNQSAACSLYLAPFRSLVNENTSNRAYVEFNANISDSMEVHFDVNWSSSDSSEMRTPADAPSAQAIDRSGSTTCTGCNYVVPVTMYNYTTAGVRNTFNAVRNPFVDDFVNRVRQQGGTLSTLALPTDGALYMGSAGWRPFYYGGNPMFEDGRRRNRFERDSFTITAQVMGEFTEDTWIGPLLNGIHYDFSGQYNQYMNTYWQGDLYSSRLQNALMGYGGPNCNAIDRVATDYSSAGAYNRTVGIQSETPAGTGGCQWFNPFASAWATSVVTNTANPQFNAGAPVLGTGATARPTGYANSKELIDWMWGDKRAEFQLQSATFNGSLSGTIPDSFFSLPGGEIGWAAGVNWRQVEGRRMNANVANQAEEDMDTQFCPWPDRAVVNTPAQVEPGVGTRGCATAVGAFVGTGRLAIVGATVPPWWYDNQNVALFGEVQLPITDDINLQYSVRHEEWNGGDLKGDIYSIAGKWQITDNIYIRSDYGTNYRADNALELEPGSVIESTSSQSRFGNGFLVQHATIVAPDIAPEDDKTFNFGAGWESELGEGRLRASINFFEILIDGQVTTSSTTTVYNNVFGLNTAACQANRADAAACSASGSETVTGLPTAAINGVQFANCNARLAAFINFTSPCTQGVTTSNNLLLTEAYQLNGPGFITNGIDYSIDYIHPLFDGTLSLQMTATQNMVYKARGYDVNGILFESSGHRLGYANYTRTGNESRRWRANAQVRWANDVHNISLRANYSTGVYNEALALGFQQPIQINNPLTPAVEPTLYSGWGLNFKSYLDFDLNYVYTAPFWEELELRATVLNLFDKDPSQAQGASGYYNATGNPRGRIIEIGVTKKF